MKGYAIIAGVVAVAIVVTLWAVNTRVVQVPSGGQACTMEAKLCPDGSAVGRTGPNCEFAACPSVTTTTTTTTTSGTATLAIGKNTTIKGTTIGILNLVEDSRCPADVQCIWAGTVRVRASIDSYNSDFTFTLGQPQVAGNATITLSAVIPAQKFSTQTVPLSDYRFTFTVVPKATTTGGGGQACTMEAKLCPDGSTVGRTGPNCEFAACPTYTTGVRGTVLLGPTCPVESIPPDPACADKGYATTIIVNRVGSSATFATGKSDAAGAFQFSLPSGSYTLVAAGGTTLPRCNPVDVTIGTTGYVTTNISCDTGIR